MSSFQFPSTGKVLSDDAEFEVVEDRPSFNSLPPGKSFRTRRSSTRDGNRRRFQFPSTGKVLSDSTKSSIIKSQVRVSIPFHRESPFGLNHSNRPTNNTKGVSIPFHRESPFGPKNPRIPLGIALASFNSLPPGKSFRTSYKDIKDGIRYMFQFPSTGKVLSDGYSKGTLSPYSKFQFPSTGKVLSDASVLRYMAKHGVEFQFPSTGKVLSDTLGIP